MRSFIKLFLTKVLYTFYILLNLIVSKKDEQIAFISFPGASDNCWYLYKYISENYEGLHLIWLLDNLSSKDAAVDKILSLNSNNQISIIKKWSFKGLIYFCRSKIIFHTHGTYSFVGETTKAPILVNLWHGMPIKAIGSLDRNNKYVCYSDFVISTSEFYRKIMSDAFKIPLSKTLNFGLPRNDVLNRGLSQNEIDSIFHKLEIDKSINLVIWLPTYRQSKIGDIRKDSLSSSFIDELSIGFLDDLDAKCEINNCKIIVKLHPMDSLDVNIIRDKYNHIIFFDSESFESLHLHLYDLLSISKILISDVSSVLIDCIPTNILIGILENSHSAYTRELLINLDDLKIHTFPIKQPEDLFKSFGNEKMVLSNLNDGRFDSCAKISNYFLNGKNRINIK